MVIAHKLQDQAGPQQATSSEADWTQGNGWQPVEGEHLQFLLLSRSRFCLGAATLTS